MEIDIDKVFKRKYRIVTDNYLGYEVQMKLWWWPFTWLQCKGTNTHSSLEKAEKFAYQHAKNCVKELGKL